MKQLWRVQQSQMVISIIFWSLMLTGVFYQYAKWYLEKHLGVTGLLTGMAVLFTIVVCAILFFGFLYDVIFALWKEQNVILAERNVYARYLHQSREILRIKHIWVPLLRGVGKDEDADFVERWVNKQLKIDPYVREDVKRIEEWIRSDRDYFDGVVIGKRKKET